MGSTVNPGAAHVYPGDRVYGYAAWYLNPDGYLGFLIEGARMSGGDSSQSSVFEWSFCSVRRAVTQGAYFATRCSLV